jgi:hypothetical protein
VHGVAERIEDRCEVVRNRVVEGQTLTAGIAM